MKKRQHDMCERKVYTLRASPGTGKQAFKQKRPPLTVRIENTKLQSLERATPEAEDQAAEAITHEAMYLQIDIDDIIVCTPPVHKLPGRRIQRQKQHSQVTTYHLHAPAARKYFPVFVPEVQVLRLNDVFS